VAIPSSTSVKTVFREEEPGLETVGVLVAGLEPRDEDLDRLRVAAAKNLDAALAIDQQMLAEFEALVAQLHSVLGLTWYSGAGSPDGMCPFVTRQLY
jgi:hypothetical protein